jgi:acetylserotonin N-methyltransferase
MPNFEPPTTDDRAIWELWLSGVYSPAIAVADEVGVFDSLAAESATIEDLAARLDFDVRATGILLRLLTALGLLTQHAGVFGLHDTARIYLVKTSSFYWGHMLQLAISPWHRETLLAKLKQKSSAEASGPEGIPTVTGDGRASDAWASGQVPPEQARQIAARMHSHSVAAATGAARNYDFRQIRRVLDLGGGSGCFMIAMAQAHPHLRCTVMELPTMCDVAKTYIASGEVTDRVDTVAVDMFRHPWPRSYDAVFFSNIWHDWNFKTCAFLAARTFEVLPSGGRIMLHEMLLDDDGAGPATAAAFSMLMLLGTQGQQFTFAELRGILENAGFSRIEARHTYGYYSIVTGYKA